MKLAFLSMSAVGVVIGLSLPAARKPAVPQMTAAALVRQEHPTATVLDRADSGHFLAVANVNDEPIRFVVDTGADIVALTTEDARRAHVEFDPARFSEIGHGASGPVRGQEVLIRDIVLDGKRASDVRGVVLENSPMSLLGQTYLRKIDTVEIKGDRMTLR